MKALSIEWFGLHANARSANEAAAFNLRKAVRVAGQALLSLFTATGIVLCAAWMAQSPGLLVFLQTALWTSSFVFVGLAIDLQKPSNGLGLASGVLLFILTDLSADMAPEFAIAAAAVIAAWLAVAVWRR